MSVPAYFSGRTQPELPRALHCLHRCGGRVAGPIWLSPAGVRPPAARCSRMKRYLPWLVLGFAAAWGIAGVFPPTVQSGGADLVTCGKIPVHVGGAVKPVAAG